MTDLLILTADPSTRLGLSALLVRQGYTVAYASTVSTAILFAVTEKPRLILADHAFMGGPIDLVRRLRLAPCACPPFLIVMDAATLLQGGEDSANPTQAIGLNTAFLLQQIAACVPSGSNRWPGVPTAWDAAPADRAPHGYDAA